MSETKRIVIIGGGFVGAKCARELAASAPEELQISLINTRPHFEYHGALYRTVCGASPAETCIPLREIVDERRVGLCEDSVVSIDTENQIVTGESGSTYPYDTLVIGLGCETNYFGVPGLEELSMGMKTIPDALRLKEHIHEVIGGCAERTEKEDKEENLAACNIVVVGAGPTGVELAAELAVYAKELAENHGVDPSLVGIDLIEAMPRILPTMTEEFSKKAEERIRSLGVNVFVNRAIKSEEDAGVTIQDMELKTKTVVWTAGVKANHLIADAGLETERCAKAVVNEHLQAKGFDNIFVGGDAALTEWSGMAQTALKDGAYIADAILRQHCGEALLPHSTKKPVYSIPVGPGWAGTAVGGITLWGKLGYFGRRIVDLVVFTSLLPLGRALNAFRTHGESVEACEVCKEA